MNKLNQRILIAIILGLIVLTLAAGRVIGQAHDHRPTLTGLRIAYAEINEKGFYGKLPEDKTKIILTDLTSIDDMARVSQRENGIWLIEIDIKTHPTEKQAEMDLAHEMCHQDDLISGVSEGLDFHSNAWKACMIHLAQNGVFDGLW